MLEGLNHITIAVSDLAKSFNFYVSILGMKPEVKWETGAYLSVGELWVCLSVDEASPAKDYSHISFAVAKAAFNSYSAGLLAANVATWKENMSEGESLYILDPDGHKLEIHVGNLNTRLKELKSNPYKGLEWF
ncbi:fosfomycin resistance glutathione transferase [Thalassomonas haliotis]|uniref:Fosfomycin resistance glutathione transferase n=1 Tax=Thalassomonas haliotis TaxID=485448 RepID=A0ABY7V7M7_9GAMM|nr:fosfomycin resistance glutathione transferase [Thalassomonas haliotis]WDE09366.1 fosfomycin resistance glutathione transferase [Thalassomonas haliotis]